MTIHFEDLNDEEKAMAKLMVAKASVRFVYPTENLCAIARAKVKFKLGIDRCPCAREDNDRGCVSSKCYREILENGVCHCNCFQKFKDDTQN